MKFYLRDQENVNKENNSLCLAQSGKIQSNDIVPYLDYRFREAFDLGRAKLWLALSQSLILCFSLSPSVALRRVCVNMYKIPR